MQFIFQLIINLQLNGFYFVSKAAYEKNYLDKLITIGIKINRVAPSY